MSWITPTEARTLWPDAPKVDTTLQLVLDAAERICRDFAPVLAVDESGAELVPVTHRVAVVLQARALWSATRRDGDVLGIDGDGTALRVRPVDPTVQALLRPPSGVPGVA